jgi:hypothetical protein
MAFYNWGQNISWYVIAMTYGEVEKCSTLYMNARLNLEPIDLKLYQT